MGLQVWLLDTQAEDGSSDDQALPTMVPALTLNWGGQAEAGWETGAGGSRLQGS